jgi:hypothetical protein
MQELNLCDRIIKLDRGIRFVGIVNKRGEVIEGGFKHGVEPLLSGTDEQQMYIQSLSNLTMLQSYNDRLGMVRYSLTEHEKVTLMSFPHGDGILCISAMSKANMNNIRSKVMKVLKSSGSINRSRSKTAKKEKKHKKIKEKK